MVLLILLLIILGITIFCLLALLGAKGIWFWMGYFFCLAVTFLVAVAGYNFIFSLFTTPIDF